MEEISILRKLRKLLEESVKNSCSSRTGIVFSGGVDSTLIALIASKFSEVTAYAVGGKNSEDLVFARRFAELNLLSVKIKEISAHKIEENFSKVEKILKENNLKQNELNFATSFPIYFASEAASEDGITLMLSGQGGDELFGGYSRYLRMNDEEKISAMSKDAKTAYERNLKRDILMCKSHNVELKFPYFDDKFSAYALSLPLDLRIKEVTDDKELIKEYIECVDEVEGRKYIRKYALRKLAEELGVPKFIARRKKRAMQYGSESQKLLKKLKKF